MKFKLLRYVCAVLAMTMAIESRDDFGKLGGDLTLTPDKISVEIKSILWKHGANKAAELDPDFNPPVDLYGDFKGRAELIKETGALVIHGLLTNHTGLYSVELNGKPQPTTFNVAVIEGVPSRPKITESCSDDREPCERCPRSLTCGGDTTGLGTVEYIWNGDSLGDGNKTIKTNNNTQTYTCRMKNQVSEEGSEPFPNPCYLHPDILGPGGIAGIVSVVVGGSIALVLGLLRYNTVKKNDEKNKTGKKKDEKDTTAETGGEMVDKPEDDPTGVLVEQVDG